MINIMLDIETMGTNPNSAIMSIGAVKFDKYETGETFYANIDLQSSLDRGFEINGKTLTWWLKQSAEANKALLDNARLIVDVLKEFKAWCGTDNKRVWGNGSDFDNVIVANAYNRLRATPPWSYFENRCFRTLRYSLPKIDYTLEGVAHNALDDARFQANYLIKLVAENKLENVI